MREKLIELIRDAVNGCSSYWAGLIADNLIDNGVTLPEKVRDYHWATEQAYKNGYEAGKRDATDNNVGCKWIPVTERLPQGADGKSLCKNVIAYTIDGQVVPGWLNGAYWYLLLQDDTAFTRLDRDCVTHWMPLPKPPKENT